MKNIEKDLLLADLSRRLPYKTYCALKGSSPQEKKEPYKGKYLLTNISVNELHSKDVEGYPCLCSFEGLSTPMDLNEVRPYLKKIENITEEDRKEIERILDFVPPRLGEPNSKGFDNILLSCVVGVGLLSDWLDLNHYDYRGLIEKDLAIEVTEKNDPYKE